MENIYPDYRMFKALVSFGWEVGDICPGAVICAVAEYFGIPTEYTCVDGELYIVSPEKCIFIAKEVS